MTTKELEQLTLEYIRDIYKKEYVGKIEVHKLDPIGYSIHLGMNTPLAPLVICGILEDEEFKKFLWEEIRAKKFHLVSYGELKENYPYDCKPRDTSCNCHDKGKG